VLYALGVIRLPPPPEDPGADTPSATVAAVAAAAEGFECEL